MFWSELQTEFIMRTELVKPQQIRVSLWCKRVRVVGTFGYDREYLSRRLLCSTHSDQPRTHKRCRFLIKRVMPHRVESTSSTLTSKDNWFHYAENDPIQLYTQKFLYSYTSFVYIYCHFACTIAALAYRDVLDLKTIYIEDRRNVHPRLYT